MRSCAFGVLLTFAGSALCWWPLIIEPNLELPWWVPLICIALCASLATALCSQGWPKFLAASATGTFFGHCAGYSIWWPTDPIAGSYVLIGVVVATSVAVLIALVAALAGRRLIFSSPTHRRAAWMVLVGCAAFGPFALALTPPLVRYRIRANDRVAALRFESLKNAVQQTASDPNDLVGICNGSAVKRHYSGPRFSEDDWHRITGNYVKQDGYFFMVYCREQGGYTIDAMPARTKGDGTRRFCTDESGRPGCGMKFNGSRHACTSCPR